MCGKHAEDSARGIDQRSGLDAARAGVEYYFQRGGAIKDRALSDVFDNDPPGSFHGCTADCLSLVDLIEKREERLVESVVGFDMQHSRIGIEQLDIAHIGANQSDGDVDDFSQ